jgi:hypothetical protein
MCGETVEGAAMAMICGTCRMGIPADAPHYLVGGRGRHGLFCSPSCVRTHVLMITPG